MEGLPLFVVRMQCPKCGYVRPEGSRLIGRKCPQCGCMLVPKPITLNPRVREPVGVACEKAGVCPGAGAKCLIAEEVPLKDGLPVRDWFTLPSKRWLYCYSWKQLLGLSFSKELGVCVLPVCPCCGADLVAELKKNLEQSRRR